MPPPEVRKSDLVDRIRAMWNRSRRLAPGIAFERGVMRFRTIEDANEAQTRAVLRRMRASRDGSAGR
jgi:hypothetical protein